MGTKEPWANDQNMCISRKLPGPKTLEYQLLLSDSTTPHKYPFKAFTGWDRGRKEDGIKHPYMFRIDSESRTLEVKDGFSGWITIEECCTNPFTLKALRAYTDANIMVESHRTEVRQIAIGTRGKGGKMDAIDKLPSM